MNDDDLQLQIGELVENKQLDEAEQLLRETLAAHPDRAAAHLSLGFVLARKGQLREAETHFRHALQQQPESLDTLRNLALCLSQQGKHRDVLSVSHEIIEIQPDVGTNWLELGRVHRRLKDRDAAVQAFRKAIELQPDLADAHHDLGLTLADLERAEEATVAYRKALELQPDFVEALNNLGVLLEGQGQLDEAIELLRQAVAFKRAPDLLNNLGVALASNREFEDAIRCYRSALELDSSYAAALNNLGNAQRSVGRIEEAIASLQQALRLRPDYAEAYNNLAIALVQSGRHEEAMRYYNQALHFRPDYAEAHMNRSLDRLALSDFEAGWIEYEWRWRGKQLRSRYADRLRWDGSSPAGKRILIHFEQGLGDTFQFIRYAKLLKKLGATVIAEVQKPAVNLLRNCEDLDLVVTTGDELPEFDMHAPLLSLPGLMGTTLATIPSDVPYLRAPDDLVEKWREPLARLPGFKIGIAWQGNPDYRGDRHRSIPLRHFAGLARIPGVTLVSLQKGHGVEQITELHDRFELTVFDDLDERAGPFMDTAAIMSHLDLIVTSDTALPHLAGALGTAVWMALPIACDWRWMHGREDSPWYPTMRLFRQREIDHWEEVFDRIVSALPQRLVEHQSHGVEPDSADRELAEALWSESVDLINDNKLAEAEQRLLDAVRRDPDNAKLHHDLGVVRGRQGRPEHAVASFRRALELNPRSAAIWGNLGLAFLEQDKIEEAISHLQRALAWGPNAPETFNNLGVAFMRHADPADAAANYQRALRLRPDYAEAHLNLARALLIQGDFEQGWLEYEWRWRCPGYEPRDDSKPRWGGEPLSGRTILLYAEQGLGDTLQFVRFAAMVKNSGGNVIVECQPPLVAILQNCDGVDHVIPRGAPLPGYDLHAPLMSLPSLLGVAMDGLSAAVPYLHPRQDLLQHWREKLDRLPGIKVGICWQGNPDYDGDRNRSLDLSCLTPLANMKDVMLINLQKGAGAEQLANRGNGFRVTDFGAEVDEANGAFMDSAAIMGNLSLLVTTDTAIAHLAGALGVPVLLLLPTAPDFRWLLQRDDSPWYPSMRILRQRQRGDWEELIARLTAEVHEVLSDAKAVSLPTTLAAAHEAAGLHEEARARIEQGSLDMAAELLERAVKANPRLTPAHLDLGVVLARLQRFENAVAHLRLAVEQAPDAPLAYGNLGLALLESGDADEAVRVLEAGLRLDPDSTSMKKHFEMALRTVALRDP